MLSLLRRLSVWCCPHLLLSTGACSCRLISTACRMLSSKPTGRRFCCRLMGQTDAQPLHRPCSAYYAGTSINLYLKVNLSKRLRHEYSVGHSGSLYLSLRPKSRTLVWVPKVWSETWLICKTWSNAELWSEIVCTCIVSDRLYDVCGPAVRIHHLCDDVRLCLPHRLPHLRAQLCKHTTIYFYCCCWYFRTPPSATPSPLPLRRVRCN